MKSGHITISESHNYNSIDKQLNSCCCKRKIKFLVVLLVCCILELFFLLYLHFSSMQFEKNKDSENEFLAVIGDHCSISTSKRFDCLPRGLITEDNCISKGCCWENREDKNIPVCFYPAQYNTYKFINISEHNKGITAFMELVLSSPYNDIKLLKFDVHYISDSQLRIKICDPVNKRYEPPYPTINIGGNNASSNFQVKISEKNFGFQVIRASNNRVIFDSKNVGGFIFSDKFLQLSAILPSKYIYGLGHQRNKFLLNMDWNTVTLFNHDLPPTDKKYINTDKPNFYSSHPFYLMMEDDGLSHGVLFLNSNAMDIILQPSPGITFRTIGGIIDLYFFIGPSPSEVIQQYTALIGRPYLPPYWSLGFHLSRLGYGSVNETKEVLINNRLVGIPVDTQWNDLDYMDRRNDFTYDKNTFDGIKQFVEYLHQEEMHYVILVDPGISAGEPSGSYPPYDEGITKKLFIMDNTGQKPFLCRVWNKSNKTVFPDFTNPLTAEYWQNQLEEQFQNQFRYDGIWLDMNEPTNFINGSFDGCPNNSLDNPPYLPRVDGDLLSFHTICMSAKHYAGNHYDLHNVYGLTQTIATTKALENITRKRAFVITRATFPGIGHYSGTWTGDVSSTWDDMEYSVADVLSFSLFGIPFVGADICGFNYNTTVPLCQRWSQLGAFYPFSRNHNSDDTVVQDPFTLGPEVYSVAKKALNVRYTLLPYLYTLFWQANTTGSTVARPVFFEFPEDKQTYSQYQQFLWGSSLLIAPILFENKTTVNVYLPKGIWYNYYTKQPIITNGSYEILSAPDFQIPLLLRGGSIIPTQDPASTTLASRRNKMDLIVAPDQENSASGSLYWDDGESLNTFEKKLYNHVEFKLSNKKLESKILHWGYDKQPVLGSVTVVGISEIVKSVKVNEKILDRFNYDVNTKVLQLQNLDLSFHNLFDISWTV
ncbi:lysosomal alpha-glucosidase-like [Lycorma delicatula]|uniref:lysosomal alpha-glucosidase-like n=1 Tax=Lycorma delicatula TaxID=130591 RepID=UPI003F510D74